MKDNLEGVFKEIPYKEALEHARKDQKGMEEYKARGAVFNGKRPIDMEYTDFLKEAAKYQLQFTEKELYVLLGNM